MKRLFTDFISSHFPPYLLTKTFLSVSLSFHSFTRGATCSINASHKLKDNKNIKLTATLHPGICGPFGPPPCPSCWTTETLEEVASARPLLFTTATNDGAFWPAPHTAEHEYGCYLKSVGESDDTGNLHPLAFVQFNADVCAEDGNREPLIEDSGHMCVSKNVVDGVAPEFEWLIKAVKLFGQLGGDEKSVCYSMIYGEESNSLKMANETDVLDIRV